jgi:hypothetical protein
MQKLIISLICCLLPALALADQVTLPQEGPPLRADAPNSYTVVKGDTLWDISGKFFKDPWKWPQIWGLNKEAIKNPHWIYPGDVIVLDREHMQLHAIHGGAATTAESGVPPTHPAVIPDELKERTLHGERVSPHVIAGPGEHDAIPTIPYADIAPFLNKTLVIDEGELDDSPEIVAGFERSLLSNGDIAYVSKLPSNMGNEWQIYREGSPLLDPSSGAILGYEAVYLGNARVQKFDKISTVRIYGTKEEIYPGDRLVQSPGEFPENFIPRPPDDDISARVIKIVHGITMAGPNSVVVINKGRRDGLQNGHVLALYHKGATIGGGNFGLAEDTDMPDMRYGLLFIFRTFRKVSYGLVMDASMPVEMLDVAETP